MTQADPADEKLRSLAHLIDLIDARVALSGDFKHAVGKLSEHLAYVAQALRRDPQSWRSNRAFHAVHVPSLIAVVSVLGDIDDMASVSDDDAHQILASLNRASGLAHDARRRLEQAALASAKVELDVLSSYATPPDEPYVKPSMFSRALTGVVSASEAAWDGAKTGATSLPGLAGNLQDGVKSTVARAGSVPMLVANLQKTLAGTVSDTVSKPVSMRLKASRHALESGVGTGVGLGVIVGVLCPPLLPLTAGGAVLVAMRSWRNEMERARDLNDAERSVREAELKAERSAALRQLTQGAGALQMENEELSLTLDVDTGEADAVILKGEHAGQMWSSLSVTEKAGLTLDLANATGGILRILAAASLD